MNVSSYSISTGSIDDGNKAILDNYSKTNQKALEYSFINLPANKHQKQLESSSSWMGKSISYLLGYGSTDKEQDTQAKDVSQENISEIFQWALYNQLEQEADSPSAKTTLLLKDKPIQTSPPTSSTMITPAVAEMFLIAFGLTGGISTVAILLAAEYLISKALTSSGKKGQKMTLETINQLPFIQLQGNICTIGNIKIGTESLKHIITSINKIALCEEIKNISKENIREFIESKLILQENGSIMMPDGTVLSNKDIENILSAINLLSTDNLISYSESIIEMIDLISRHTFNTVLETPSKTMDFDKHFIKRINHTSREVELYHLTVNPNPGNDLRFLNPKILATRITPEKKDEMEQEFYKEKFRKKHDEPKPLPAPFILKKDDIFQSDEIIVEDIDQLVISRESENLSSLIIDNYNPHQAYNLSDLSPVEATYSETVEVNLEKEKK